MLRLGWLDDHQPALVGSEWQVLDATWYHMKVALLQNHLGAVAEAQNEDPFADEEKLVLVCMGMPHKLALHLGKFHELAVRGGNDAGRLVLGDVLELSGY